ncbi:retrotransposon protein, putative, ty1-copia subclass [Tanacetum coccineum]
MGYYFYNPSENKVFVARNAKFLESNLLDQEASGSIEDLEIIQEEDTNPSLDTSLSSMNKAEHELGDLSEPANYKAALKDPESKKWLTVMNVEMQSNEDNVVWQGLSLKTYWVDYEETFSPVADIRAIRILIAITAFYDYKIWQIDVKTASFIWISFREFDMTQPKRVIYIEKILKSSSMENSKRGVDIRITRKAEIERLMKSEALGFLLTTDAGYLTDADDLKSQTGYVFVLNGGDVDWKSTKQSISATSSTDAEYIAAFDTLEEAVWIRKFISGINVVPIIKEPITMYYDNTGAIAITNDMVSLKVARTFLRKSSLSFENL